VDKRGQVTLSSFIIAIILVSLFSMAIFTFLAEMDNSYDDTSYENLTSKIGGIEQVQNTTANLEKAREELETIETNNPFDVVGKVLSGGIEIFKLSFSSLDSATSISADAVEQIKTSQTEENANGNQLWSSIEAVIFALILVTFVVGIGLYLVTGRRT